MSLRLPLGIALLALPALLAACQRAPVAVPAAEAEPLAYSGIGSAEEPLRFAGTEPFWGGELRGGKMTFSSPDNQQGEIAVVSRVGGQGDAVFSGRLAAGAFTLTAELATCSDGMSDRSYPFAVTVKFAGYTLQGCGWTARQPYTGEAG